MSKSALGQQVSLANEFCLGHFVFFEYCFLFQKQILVFHGIEIVRADFECFSKTL